DGTGLYITSARADAVFTFRIDPTTGLLTPVGSVDQTTVPSLDAPVSIALSPDAGSVYVAGVTANALTVLLPDATTGVPDAVRQVIQEGQPHTITLSSIQNLTSDSS